MVRGHVRGAVVRAQRGKSRPADLVRRAVGQGAVVVRRVDRDRRSRYAGVQARNRGGLTTRGSFGVALVRPGNTLRSPASQSRR